MPVKPPIMPGWDGFDVVRHVQRSLPVPVLVDNDVNIMALGERTAHWPEDDNFLFIKVATGIGAGHHQQRPAPARRQRHRRRPRPRPGSARR